MATLMNAPLLSIQHLSVQFGEFSVIRDFSLDVHAGQTVCLVGESGSGKSMTAFSILGLVPPPGRLVSGSIFLEDTNMTQLAERDLCRMRGRDIAMIFQEPMTSLNPVLRVGDQVAEPLRLHLGLSRREALQQAEDLLRTVGIPAPESRVRDYPHQLSGGMRQRVMIAMALACKPRLLLADEPTTALDVTIQGQILGLLRQLSTERDMGMLLITHDLGVVADMADVVGVMYAGELVETAPADQFFRHAGHPYSLGLMQCAPTIENRHVERLATMPGTVPSPSSRPQGCAFRARCPRAFERCFEEPPVINYGANHCIRCWMYAN